MADSNVANAMKESAQAEFSHGLLDFCPHGRKRAVPFETMAPLITCEKSVSRSQKGCPRRSFRGRTWGQLIFQDLFKKEQ
jgi:hypothetical protein